jgi:predicted transcriptional regulator
MKPISLRLSKEMQDKLKDIATDEDRSVSNVIRRAIDACINSKKAKRSS